MGGEKYKSIAYVGVGVFTLAIIYFIVSIYITMSNGELRSQDEFRFFVQDANVNRYETLQSNDDFDNYFQTLKESIDRNSYIGAVIITVGNEPAFAYPLSSNVIEIDYNNKPVLLSSSPMLKTHSMSLQTQNSQTAVLNAISYVLRPQDIYNSARVSFLIILAYTLVLLVIVVYTALTHNSSSTTMRIAPSQKNAARSDDREVIPVVFKEQESSWDDFFDRPENAFDINSIKHDVQYVSDEVNDSIEQANIIEEDTPFDDIFVDEYLNEEAGDDFSGETMSMEFDMKYDDMQYDSMYENDTEKKLEDSTISTVNDPMGLFSDITGVGWESYLETRLDSELIRSASSEQDLALVFIQLKGIEKNISLKKKVATLLINHFKYRDFVFEYKDDGFAGIIVDISLDNTMLLCEQLYSQLDSLVKNEHTDMLIGVGLSTRSLRILPGSRLITEASQAVERAFQENGLPIVAFRVSPEKYRQYVSNSSI